MILKSRNKKIKLPVKKTFLIIGVNPIIFKFLYELEKKGISKNNIFILSESQRIDNDLKIRLLDYETKYIDKDDHLEMINTARKYNANICMVFGWYSILRKELINHFDGLIFNLHFGDLPEYRGGGSFSWQVLNGQKKLGAYIHQITNVVDGGGILLSVKGKIYRKIIYPKHFKKLSSELAEKLIKKLSKKIIHSSSLILFFQQQEISTYFPKLSTNLNGFINFSWNIKNVCKFVRAFSYPFKGAIFNYKDSKYYVKEAYIFKKKNIHPYASGLILAVTNSSIHVALFDGILRLEKIFNFNDLSPAEFSGFKPGGRLFNDNEKLFSAKILRSID